MAKKKINKTSSSVEPVEEVVMNEVETVNEVDDVNTYEVDDVNAYEVDDVNAYEETPAEECVASETEIYNPIEHETYEPTELNAKEDAENSINEIYVDREEVKKDVKCDKVFEEKVENRKKNVIIPVFYKPHN